MRSIRRLALLALFAGAFAPGRANALPDLYVLPTPLTLSRPGVAVGDTITLGSWVLQNIGDATVAPIEVGYYLSLDQTITPADALIGTFTIPGGLGADAVFNVPPTTLTIPGGTAPQGWYLGPFVDRTLAIAENNEANNFNKVALDVLGPDLDIVTALSATPIEVAPGDTIRLGFTVQNVDSAGAHASTMAIYLSANSQLDTTDVRLRSLPTDSLPPGATQSWANEPVVIPISTPAGSPFLIAFADADQVVVETRENNNSASRLIRVGPDLLITSGAPVVDPDTVAVGDSISVSAWSTRNSGAQDAGSSFGGYYLSLNTTIGDAGDILLGSVATPALAEDATHNHPSIKLAIPPGTLPGTYVVGIFTDHTNQVPEHTETNNTVRTLGTVSAPHLVVVGPDLHNVALAAAPTALAPGMATLATWTVANPGVAATPACSLGLYLSNDSTFSPGTDALLARRGLPSIAALAQAGDTVTLVIPGTTTPRRAYILSVADDLGQVAETSETNNKRAVAITIGPNLVVSSQDFAVVPNAVLPGDSVTLAPYAITNTGAVGTPPFVVGFYLSSNGSINSADLLLTTTLVGGLGPGQSMNFDSTAILIPADSQPGDRHIGLLADKDLDIDEFDETDNDLATAITLFGPDLTFVTEELELDAYGSGPFGPTQGFPLAIGPVTIRNTGTWFAGPSSYGLYFSPDDDVTADDLLVATGALPSLLIDEEYVLPADTILVPNGQDLGDQHFGILLDHNDVVNEITEGDELSAPISIHTLVDVPTGLPASVRLSPPSPNPSHGEVAFRIALPRESGVTLELFDHAGRRVQKIERWLGAGEHALKWDGRDGTGRFALSGVFVYRVTAAGVTRTGRVAIVR